jgi:hypothetical protein
VLHKAPILEDESLSFSSAPAGLSHSTAIALQLLQCTITCRHSNNHLPGRYLSRLQISFLLLKNCAVARIFHLIDCLHDSSHRCPITAALKTDRSMFLQCSPTHASIRASHHFDSGAWKWGNHPHALDCYIMSTSGKCNGTTDPAWRL